MRVIIDTNILINVILSPKKSSASYRVLELCLRLRLFPQIGEALFAEYEDLTCRPHIVSKSAYTQDEINQVLDGFLSVCKWNKIHYLWRPNLRDEADNHLIDLAVASNTKWIVTQNVKDLNSGELKFGIKVLTPEQLLKEVN